MRLLRHLPNTLTSLNLLCGVVGIVWLIDFRTGSDLAFWVVLVACFFDFLDGFAARLLKVSSPIGKELDSLADMTTFGVYPSLVMMLAIRDAGAPNDWLPYTALLLAVCSALRLAKFNTDERQTDGFIGVPTPANALFITSVPLLLPQILPPGDGIEWYVLVGLTLLFSWLMVSPFPLFALKFKSFGWKGNEVRFTFLALAVLLFGFLRVASVPLIIIIYVVLSLVVGRRVEGTVSK